MDDVDDISISRLRLHVQNETEVAWLVSLILTQAFESFRLEEGFYYMDVATREFETTPPP